MNCKNCGASLGRDGLCRYCGSYYREQNDKHYSAEEKVSKQPIIEHDFFRNCDFTTESSRFDIDNYSLRDMLFRYIEDGKVDASEAYSREMLIYEYSLRGRNSYIDTLIEWCKKLPVK